MRTKGFLLSTALFFTAGQAAADSLDVNLHEDAVRAIYTAESNDGNGMDVDAGVLYNEADDLMVHLGAHVAGQNWSKKGTFDIRVGGRAIGFRADPGDAYGFGLGGRVRFSPVQRVGLGGHAYYGPEIITFGDGKRFIETGLRADYQLLPHAFVYAGYRMVEFKFEDLDDGVKADSNLHVGMFLLF